MKINENQCLVGNRVVLIPYKSHHVPKYHEWMKNEELRELTGSEPLSLNEEFNMQKSWHTDSDKCTFIILDQDYLNDLKSETDSMIGDVNLFLTDASDLSKAEIEIMIADPSVRKQGRGKEALLLMMQYGIEHLGIATFEAKIKITNETSLKLFQKLGFIEVSRSQVFQEVTLNRMVDPEWTAELTELAPYAIDQYNYACEN